RHRHAILLLLQVLENAQLDGGILGAAGLAIQAVQLEMRSGQARVQIARALKLADRRRQIAAHLVERANLVMRRRVEWHQARHLLEQGQGAVELRLLLPGDAQVEPGVRKLGIELLGLLQLGDALRRVARAQQGQTIVDDLARATRRRVARFAKLIHRLPLRGGVLVEGLPQVAIAPEPLLVRAAQGSRQYPSNSTEGGAHKYGYGSNTTDWVHDDGSMIRRKGCASGIGNKRKRLPRLRRPEGGAGAFARHGYFSKYC